MILIAKHKRTWQIFCTIKRVKRDIFAFNVTSIFTRLRICLRAKKSYLVVFSFCLVAGVQFHSVSNVPLHSAQEFYLLSWYFISSDVQNEILWPSQNYNKHTCQSPIFVLLSAISYGKSFCHTDENVSVKGDQFIVYAMKSNLMRFRLEPLTLSKLHLMYWHSSERRIYKKFTLSRDYFKMNKVK